MTDLDFFLLELKHCEDYCVSRIPGYSDLFIIRFNPFPKESK